MAQNWHLRSRAQQCAQTETPFEDGQPMYTAIYLDPETAEYVRRDVSLDAWEAEMEERTPYSYWKTVFVKPVVEEKPEIAPKESAYELLQRLVEEDDPQTENARYILAVMLERKRQLVETDVKEGESGKMRFYENRKSGDVFVVRDPELHLDELEGVQDDVAMRLGFGGPAAEAAKVAGVQIGADGKVIPKATDSRTGTEDEASDPPPQEASADDGDAPQDTAVEEVGGDSPSTEDQVPAEEVASSESPEPPSEASAPKVPEGA